MPGSDEHLEFCATEVTGVILTPAHRNVNRQAQLYPKRFSTELERVMNFEQALGLRLWRGR